MTDEYPRPLGRLHVAMYWLLAVPYHAVVAVPAFLIDGYDGLRMVIEHFWGHHPSGGNQR
jgi:hypothetical protein